MIETKARRAFGARLGGRWSNFSISGKLMSTCGWPLARARVDQLRQAVQRLRAEHQVDVGRALDDRLAFLASRRSRRRRSARALAAASGACQRPSWLNTFSCAFSRIEQVLTRITSASSTSSVSSSPCAARQHVGHLGRVVLVHLAAVGLDEELSARRGGSGVGRGRARRHLGSGHIHGRSGRRR